MQERLASSKDVPYPGRRVKKQFRESEMECLVEEMRSWTGWSDVVRVDETNHFAEAFLFHDRVVNQEYAKDICVIIDDTSCTNYFGLPILVAMSEDENGLSQGLTFGVMISREKAKFIVIDIGRK